MDSSSDSEECELYTRTAENIRRKREQLKFKLDSNIENHTLELGVSVEEIGNTSLMNTLSNDKRNTNVDINKHEHNKIPIVESRRNLRSGNKHEHNKIPLVESRRNLRSSGKPLVIESPIKRANKPHRGSSKKRRKRTCNTHDNTDVAPTACVILDDDLEFTKYSLSPIKFNTVSCTSNSTIDYVDLSEGNSLPDVIINDDYDDDEPVIISIEWTSGKIFCKQFKLHRYQKFATVFEELAKIEGLPTNRISLMRDSKIITPADTPESLDLKYYAGLTGSVSATAIDYSRLTELSTNINERNQEGSLTVQLRLENQKTLKFTIMKHQKMRVLYKKCSEELECKESLIKLVFDGDYVEPKELVSSLDLEDDDIFNVYIKKE